MAGLIDQKKVVIGGASDPDARYLDPTVIYPVTWDDPIMEDEIFGPLLPILTYKDMDAAIREVKENPAFVDATANIPDAAKKIVWGATAWGGQWCTSPGYAYVHESIAEEFVAECKKADG